MGSNYCRISAATGAAAKKQDIDQHTLQMKSTMSLAQLIESFLQHHRLKGQARCVPTPPPSCFSEKAGLGKWRLKQSTCWDRERRDRKLLMVGAVKSLCCTTFLSGVVVAPSRRHGHCCSYMLMKPSRLIV